MEVAREEVANKETEGMGVAGYKYMLDEGFVANSTYNVTNACYNPELDLAVDLPVNTQKISF